VMIIYIQVDESLIQGKCNTIEAVSVVEMYSHTFATIDPTNRIKKRKNTSINLQKKEEFRSLWIIR